MVWKKTKYRRINESRSKIFESNEKALLFCIKRTIIAKEVECIMYKVSIMKIQKLTSSLNVLLIEVKIFTAEAENNFCMDTFLMV